MSDKLHSTAEALIENTYSSLIPFWMNNFAENLKIIRKGVSITDLKKLTGQPCILVGGGPSLTRFAHLRKIKESGWHYPIFTCDRELKSCLNHGIIPDIVASVDGSPLVARYYKHKIVRKHALDGKTKAVFCVTVHPNVVDTWLGPRYWFVALLDEIRKKDGSPNLRSVSFILHLLSRGKAMISAVGNVGSFLWNLATALECSPIILVGYDFSEQVKFKEQAVYWKPLIHMLLRDKITEKEAKDKAAALHWIERNPDFNRSYLMNPIWWSYREQIKMHIISSKIKTVNCTENGCLHTEAIKCPNFTALSLKETLEIFGEKGLSLGLA